MRLAIILVFVFLGLVVTAILYVVDAHRRSKRKTITEERNEVRQDEAPSNAQSEPPTHAHVPHEVRNEPNGPSKSTTQVAVEADRPERQQLQPVLGEEHPSSEQKSEMETPTVTPGACEVTEPPRGEPCVEVCSPQGKNDLPTRDSEEELNSAEEASDVADDLAPTPTTRIAPDKRGGRSRTPKRNGEKGKTVGNRRRAAKPEIVCWKNAREWVLGVEMPEDLREPSAISVVQDEVSLTRDNLEVGCWPLTKLGGQVVVRSPSEAGQSEVKIQVTDDNHLVFKLSGAGLNHGRRVNQPSSGSYLVIVPEDWERHEELAGTAPAMPELVRLEGYRAHFFDLIGSSTSQIAFRDRTGRSFVIGSTGPHFDLVAQELHESA